MALYHNMNDGDNESFSNWTSNNEAEAERDCWNPLEAHSSSIIMDNVINSYNQSTTTTTTAAERRALMSEPLILAFGTNSDNAVLENFQDTIQMIAANTNGDHTTTSSRRQVQGPSMATSTFILEQQPPQPVLVQQAMATSTRPLPVLAPPSSLTSGILTSTTQSQTQPQEQSQPLPEKPKRGRNCYNYFFKHHREMILKSHGQVGFEGLAKTIAQRWKNISAQDKAYFNHLAAQDKIRHRNEMKVWKKQQDQLRSSGASVAAATGTSMMATVTPPPLMHHQYQQHLQGNNGEPPLLEAMHLQLQPNNQLQSSLDAIQRSSAINSMQQLIFQHEQQQHQMHQHQQQQLKQHSSSSSLQSQHRSQQELLDLFEPRPIEAMSTPLILGETRQQERH